MSRAVMENDIQTKIHSDDISSEYRNIFNERYHRINKRLLCLCGLWPGQSFLKRSPGTIGLLIASFVVMTGQLRAMIAAWGHFNLFVECFTPLETNCVGILKIVTSMIKAQETKKICDHMQKDWDQMRYSPQLHVLEKFAEKGRYWTIFYFILFSMGFWTWTIMAFIPKVMDILVPLNYSRRRFDLFPTDFGIDGDKYFFHIQIPLVTGVAYSFLVNVTVDTLYMVVAQHVCAMFHLLRYDLHNIVQDDERIDVIGNPAIEDDKHYHAIIACIKRHKAITEYVRTIENACGWRLILLIGLSMVGLSFTGYLLISTANGGSKLDATRFAAFGIAQVFHIFCNTLPSHWIMEASACIPVAAYSCKWYMMSLRARKLILFVIRASIEPCKIVAAKIYVVSMENFSSVSYLMFIDTAVFNPPCTGFLNLLRRNLRPIRATSLNSSLNSQTYLAIKVLQTSMSYLTMLNSMQ